MHTHLPSLLPDKGSLTLALSFILALQLPAQLPTEEDYYKITTFDTPEGSALEVSSIELLPGDKLALGTRRGEIWIAANAAAATQSGPEYSLFASGLHEVLGLAWKEGWLYATIRYELVRMKDSDGDGRADVFETVCDRWGVSGDYHEYAFGSRFDRDGNIWVTLCLTGSFSSNAPFRGWAVRITPEGKMIPTCSGVRSPGGIGFDAEGEVYFTDNQGPWRGSSTLQHLVPGSFQGHPGGFRWYDQAPELGPRPSEPADKSRMVTERDRIPELLPPAVYLVHGKVGNSPTAVICDTSDGKFGPFKNQLFVPDQSHSNISRVFLETVGGIRQGAVFPFRSGFKSGLIGGRIDDAGHLFVGGSDRGWGARGGQPYCFERLDWTGEIPFEIHEMRAAPDGFTLTFTQPVDPATASDPDSYSMRAFTYIYQSDYGSPEVDEVLPEIRQAIVSDDASSIRLIIHPLTRGHVHELRLPGLRSSEDTPLLHPSAWYTLNEIPVAP